jgi:hypothetical protein
MKQVTEKLMEFMKIGYPELSEEESALKIERWLNMPNLYFGGSTPRKVCEMGREDKVLLQIQRFFDGDMP